MNKETRITADLTDNEEVFVGSGEMAAKMRSLDWSKTSVGAVETWSQSLKTTVRILLTFRFAMWMAWGDELTFFL